MAGRLHRFLIVLLLTLTVSMVLSSCSSISKIMMPYHENFECNRGVDYGYCGPLDKVYQQTLKQDNDGGEK